MRVLLFIVVAVMVGCRSGEIACPEPEMVKLKRSSGFFNLRKKKRRDYTMARANDTHSNYYRQERDEDYKKFISIEEWDCPRPDAAKNRKIARNHRKAQEKKARADEKRRREMESDSLSVLPSNAPRMR